MYAHHLNASMYIWPRSNFITIRAAWSLFIILIKRLINTLRQTWAVSSVCIALFWTNHQSIASLYADSTSVLMMQQVKPPTMSPTPTTLEIRLHHTFKDCYLIFPEIVHEHLLTFLFVFIVDISTSSCRSSWTVVVLWPVCFEVSTASWMLCSMMPKRWLLTHTILGLHQSLKILAIAWSEGTALCSLRA